MKSSAWVTVAVVTALSAWPVAAQTTDVPRYAYHPWGGPWHGWFMGPFMMIVVVVVVIAVVVLITRWSRNGGGSHTGSHRGEPVRAPLDILKERFAKGEIDKEEFEERRRILDE